MWVTIPILPELQAPPTLVPAGDLAFIAGSSGNRMTCCRTRGHLRLGRRPMAWLYTPSVNPRALSARGMLSETETETSVPAPDDMVRAPEQKT